MYASRSVDYSKVPEVKGLSRGVMMPSGMIVREAGGAAAVTLIYQVSFVGSWSVKPNVYTLRPTPYTFTKPYVLSP